MILFLIFGILAAANAERFVNVPMGSLDVVAGVGEVPFKYEPLDAKDVMASVNGTNWALSMMPYISTGTPLIPPVDPYVKDRLSPLDVQNSFASGKIYLKNLVARGMKDAVLTNLEMRLQNFRDDVSLTIPVLTAEVDYSAALKAGFLPLTYDGHVKILMEDVSAHVATKTTLKKFKGVPVFQLEAIQLTATARNLELSVAEAAWNAISDQAKVLFEDIIQQAMTILAKTILTDVNLILRQVPAQTMMNYLIGSS